MNTFFQFSAVAVFSLVGAGGTWLIKGSPQAPPVREIRCDATQIKGDEICLADVPGNVLWIDARLRSEWEQDGLEGSLLWNLDPSENQQSFEVNVATGIVGSQAPLVVVYCGSEACGTSRQVADRIRSLEMGPEIRVLYGGWDALKFRDSNSVR